MSAIVHVHYARSSTWTASAVEEALAVLEPSELGQADRFRFERDRTMYIFAHSLLRHSLARHYAVEPAAWRFTAGSHGRPEIAGPAATSRLRFSLSHTRELAACAIVRDLDIGFDVESASREAPLEIADRWFAPSEVKALSALPKAARAQRFFVYWTLKEAYVKARGLGLSLPLHQFAFDVADDEVRVRFGSGCPDDEGTWRFRSWLLGDSHWAALAVRTSAELTVEISEG